MGLIPTARLCANKEATVFFFGFDTPRPRFLGRPSLYCTRKGRERKVIVRNHLQLIRPSQ